MSLYKCLSDSLFSCKDRASERHRPNARKKKIRCFFLSEPVAFRRVYGLESYSRTSGESNHHRQSVSATRVTPYQLSHEGDCAEKECSSHFRDYRCLIVSRAPSRRGVLPQSGSGACVFAKSRSVCRTVVLCICSVYRTCGGNL